MAPLQLAMDISIYRLHPYLEFLALMQRPQKEDKSNGGRLSKAPAISLSACASRALCLTQVCVANIATRLCCCRAESHIAHQMPLNSLKGTLLHMPDRLCTVSIFRRILQLSRTTQQRMPRVEERPRSLLPSLRLRRRASRRLLLSNDPSSRSRSLCRLNPSSPQVGDSCLRD